MHKMSTDSQPNIPESVNLDSSCTDDDALKSASCESNFTVDDDLLFTVNIVSISGFSERLCKT